MKKATLDGRAILDRAALHDELQTQLALPAWYGRNLDALFDCLTDIFEDTQIDICAFSALEKGLDGYAHVLLTVLLRAQAENAHLHILIDGAPVQLDEDEENEE